MTSDLKIRMHEYRVDNGMFIFSPSEQEKAIPAILSGLTNLGGTEEIVSALYDSPELCELAVSCLMLFNAKNGDLDVKDRLQLLVHLREASQPESIRMRAGQQLVSMGKKDI